MVSTTMRAASTSRTPRTTTIRRIGPSSRRKRTTTRMCLIPYRAPSRTISSETVIRSSVVGPAGGLDFAALSPVEIRDGNYVWQAQPGVEYELSPAGWEVMNIGVKALSIQGVYHEADPLVDEYLDQNLGPGLLARLTPDDRRVLEENRYGFLLEV